MALVTVKKDERNRFVVHDFMGECKYWADNKPIKGVKGEIYLVFRSVSGGEMSPCVYGSSYEGAQTLAYQSSIEHALSRADGRREVVSDETGFRVSESKLPQRMGKATLNLACTKKEEQEKRA